MTSTLDIHIYAAALKNDDSRPLAIVRGLERSFPGLHLGWTVSDERQLVSPLHRDAWLTQAVGDGGFPLVCNNDEGYPVMISGSELSASAGPGGQPLLDVNAELPLDAVVIAAAADMLEAVAEGAQALWGHATPSHAAVDIAQQTVHPNVPRTPSRGLPALKRPWEIHSSVIPHRLGWLNYWSAAAARAIGFPDPTRDAALLSRSRRTATGGWVVAVTKAPLELDSLAHLDALLRTYERFPEIGGRTTL